MDYKLILLIASLVISLGLSSFAIYFARQAKLFVKNTQKSISAAPISHVGAQTCSNCRLVVHRYKVNLNGQIICANCLTETK